MHTTATNLDARMNPAAVIHAATQNGGVPAPTLFNRLNAAAQQPAGG